MLTVLHHLQDYRFGGVKMDGCSNIELHGPYEQTYINKELPYTQGKILAADVSDNPGTMTVQASRERLDLHGITHEWALPSGISRRQLLPSRSPSHHLAHLACACPQLDVRLLIHIQLCTLLTIRQCAPNHYNIVAS